MTAMSYIWMAGISFRAVSKVRSLWVRARLWMTSMMRWISTRLRLAIMSLISGLTSCYPLCRQNRPQVLQLTSDLKKVETSSCPTSRFPISINSRAESELASLALPLSRLPPPPMLSTTDSSPSMTSYSMSILLKLKAKSSEKEALMLFSWQLM